MAGSGRAQRVAAVGAHFLGLPRFESLSVDPVFPNLFRFRYAVDVDVPLAEAICAEADRAGLVTKMMRNPDFRVDYGTLVACHMTRPAWDRPIVSISSCRSTAWYSVEVIQEQAAALGQATRRAIEASGKRALLLASNSLSHRHFTDEADVPEDMSREHVKLLNPENAMPACIVSSNVYSDRAETVVLGKACRDAVEATGRRTVAVVVSTLSNRLFTDWIPPSEDRIHSAKDDEWNRKVLEFLAAGRLEDVAQLSRVIHKQIRVKKVVSFKPAWWLSAVMGAHNHYTGEVLGYAAIHGTGGAVVTLEPSTDSLGDKE